MKDSCAPLCPDNVIVLPFHPFDFTLSMLQENVSSLDLSPWLQRSAEPNQCGQRQSGQARLITEQQCRGFLGISDSCHNLNVVSLRCYRKREKKVCIKNLNAIIVPYFSLFLLLFYFTVILKFIFHLILH